MNTKENEAHHCPHTTAGSCSFCYQEKDSQIKRLEEKVEELERAIPKDTLSDFYEWELQKHATEYEVEFRGNEIKQLKLTQEGLVKVLTDALGALEELVGHECESGEECSFHKTITSVISALKKVENP